MATCAKTTEEQRNDRRQQVMLDLPGDFLRLCGEGDQQQQADEQAAIALQQQLAFSNSPGALGRLTITVVEAKLNKNYGVTRMDPYVRLRLGHIVYETPTDYNGAKNPHWNKSFQCLLPSGVNTVNIELYDECAFSVDEKVAWCNYELPTWVLNGGTAEEWLLLDGKLGEAKEGAINVVFSYSLFTGNSVVYPPQTVIFQSPYYGVMPGVMPYYPTAAYPMNQYAVPGQQPQQQQQQQQQQQPQQQQQQQQQPQQWRPPAVPITEEDIKQVQDMFPSVEKDVIVALLEEYRGNKDKTINALLQMSADS